MNNDLIYQLALTAVPHIGLVQAKILAEHFGSAEAIFKSKKRELELLEGIGEVRAAAIKNFDGFADNEDEIEFIEKHHIQPLFITDKAYPRRLLNCYDSPTLLFYRGNADLNSSKIVSIIGTRNNGDYGKQLTEQLVAALQQLNVVIVSGLAYGIDAIAHKVAVQNNVATVGVLATGLDKIYPPQHASLAKQMLLNGGLLTEFRKGTLPDRHNFPQRNRIVAGLADCTVVMETAIKGGSMITAELAVGYNRDVFAFPGRTSDTRSEGCNHLIKSNKAQLISNADDLIDAMGWKDKKMNKKVQRAMFIELSNHEQILLDVLKEKESIHIDELYMKSGLNSSTVAAAMLNLEFQNVVTSLPGKMYKLN